MKKINRLSIYDKFSNEFVATSLKSGRVLAHARTCRMLFESLKRRRIDPTVACVAKVPPKNAAVIY